MLDDLFCGTQPTVEYQMRAQGDGGPTAAVVIAGATDRGYRFLKALQDDGHMTLQFQRTALPRSPSHTHPPGS